jgi:hypothetical protein
MADVGLNAAMKFFLTIGSGSVSALSITAIPSLVKLKYFWITVVLFLNLKAAR